MIPMADLTCGPENCPLTAWTALSPGERKVQRKPLAEQLYRQGFTMAQIAEQFGVDHSTIVRDLSEFVRDAQIKKHAKTASNPRGAGRPKGKKNSERKNTQGAPDSDELTTTRLQNIILDRVCRLVAEMTPRTLSRFKRHMEETYG